ncbi:MAG: hypothetical protein IJJ03_03790 [Mogibacterium sp.]|nr:hypothetical protein [Mogibacterium sp.]
MNTFMDSKKARMLGYSLSAGFMLIHIGLLFFFRYHGVTPMVWVNLCSIIFYLMTIPMLRKDMLWLYSVSVYLEVVIHMSIAVYFVGVDSGFQLTLIGMSVLAFDEDVKMSLQAGMNAHLSKPVDPDHLSRTLGELIYKAEENR